MPKYPIPFEHKTKIAIAKTPYLKFKCKRHKTNVQSNKNCTSLQISTNYCLDAIQLTRTQNYYRN